jgi:hypothetical protein
MPRKKIAEKEIVVSAAVPTRHKPATARAKRPTPAPAPAPAPAAPVTRIVPAAPSREDVASLAYSYWLARGCQGGSPEEDWLRAERELAAAAIA